MTRGLIGELDGIIARGCVVEMDRRLRRCIATEADTFRCCINMNFEFVGSRFGYRKTDITGAGVQEGAVVSIAKNIRKRLFIRNAGIAAGHFAAILGEGGEIRGNVIIQTEGSVANGIRILHVQILSIRGAPNMHGSG